MRHQERDMGGVMAAISRRGNQERPILAFDEAHQADEPKLEGLWGGRRERITRNIRTCSSGAECNSTDKVTTIHFCSYIGGLSIGAVKHQRSPSAESTA